MVDHEPLYNLSKVTRSTGLSGDVLRVWERRYGIPRPQRSSGGHRLYSEYDIEVLKWLKVKLGEGMTISRAVSLWNSLLEQNQDPIKTNLSTEAEDARGTDGRQSLDDLREAWVMACTEFDEKKATALLNKAMGVYPVEETCFSVLLAGLRELGDRWCIGEASTQQEHFATELAMRRVEAIIASTPEPTLHFRILIGCPAGETHVFPVLMAALLFKRRGWEVIYLGGSLPTEQLLETIDQTHPDVLLLAAQQLSTAAALLKVNPQAIERGVVPFFGGRIFAEFPRIRVGIPGLYGGDTLLQAVERITEFVRNNGKTPDLRLPPSIYQSLARRVREDRLQIAARMKVVFDEHGHLDEQAAEAVLYLNDDIASALELGDPGYIQYNLDWIKRLLSSRGISLERLGTFMENFGIVLTELYGTQAKPVVDWLQRGPG